MAPIFSSSSLTWPHIGALRVLAGASSVDVSPRTYMPGRGGRAGEGPWPITCVLGYPYLLRSRVETHKEASTQPLLYMEYMERN